MLPVAEEEAPAVDRSRTFLEAAVAHARLGRQPRGELEKLYTTAAKFALHYTLALYGEGRLQDGLAILGPALELPTPYRAMLRLRLAKFYRRLTNWDDTVAALDEMERDLEALGHVRYEKFRRDLTVSLAGERAQVWLEQGVIDLAAHHLDEERRLLPEDANDEVRAIHRLHEVDFYMSTADFEAAAQVCEAVLKDRSTLRPTAAAVFDYSLGIALSEVARDDPSRASEGRALLEQALDSEALGATERFRAVLGLVDLALRVDDAALAKERIAEATALLDELRGEDVQGLLLEDESLLATYALRAARRYGDADEVQAAHDALLEAYDLLLERWGATRLRKGGLGFLQFGTRRDVAAELIDLAVESEDGAERGLELLLRSQAMGTFARRFGLDAPELETIRAKLCGERSGFLVYLPAKEGTHVIAFDAESATHRKLATDRTIERLSRAFVRELRKPLRGFPDRASRDRQAKRVAKCGDALVEELLPDGLRERVRAWSAVTVVGGDLLHNVPFECLPWEAGALFGEALAVDSLPSLPLGMHLAERAVPDPEGGSRLALVATLAPGDDASGEPVLADESVEAVELTAEHAERWARHYPGGSVDLLLHDAATVDAVLGTDFSAVPASHFLVHGLYESDRERGSSLALTGGLLRCDDVDGMRASRLVILSACHAALGPNRIGDDSLTHMGGAFLVAGARCVVLSRSELQLGPTLDLMDVFHRELAAGASPAEAMRAARKANRGGEALLRYQHGQVQVLGLGHAPVFPR